MSYSDKFYNLYANYLTEVGVRVVHNRMFDLFASVVNKALNVIDFGCGLNEFYDYAKPQYYLGVDRNIHERNYLHQLEGDYVDTYSLKYVTPEQIRKAFPSIPNIFVSLFSTEASLPANQRYAFYRDIFRNYPSITHGLVSGFYYLSKKDQLLVNESGGIVSIQTIEKQDDWVYSEFTELRTYVPCPSVMFGNDVMEVWKIFIRRDR